MLLLLFVVGINKIIQQRHNYYKFLLFENYLFECFCDPLNFYCGRTYSCLIPLCLICSSEEDDPCMAASLLSDPS